MIQTIILKLTHKLWNRQISRILCRAKSEGIIGSEQLHQLAAAFDPTQKHIVYGIRVNHGFKGPAGDQQANAKLIAAAPEMLEALKSAMQCLDDFVGDGPTHRMVKAAIAKAEGASVCDKCGDSLTGHEDDSRTRCRWCVTSHPCEIDSVVQATE